MCKTRLCSLEYVLLLHAFFCKLDLPIPVPIIATFLTFGSFLEVGISSDSFIEGKIRSVTSRPIKGCILIIFSYGLGY